MPNKKKLLILDFLVLQPLDRSIYFPFKKYLKQILSEYLFKNEHSNIKENLSERRILTVKDIVKIWFGKK